MPRPDDVGLGGVVDDKRFERYMREALECLDRHIAGYLHKTRLMLG